ncbi:MAG: 4-(cytidine 5'-diphospho)-2-C-methyl-D-erythritol kinase [Spirochaetaceae bacterium]|jgi:4-diphosphocytidyl-2-C-methyl-D-erythritol kinase|nr:4-(cytidine 5'-diphospho)-2-C-methyl-D-erythritol kinase [Spirochaetaceae bacterium]
MKISRKHSISLEAPCKVNLSLSIGARRADGFHDIESIFAAVSLSDTLRFEVLDRGGVPACELRMDTSELPPGHGKTLAVLPPSKNLVLRAITLWREATGFDRAIKADVYKRIPPAAGLGGGSSDAAAALLAMYRLSNSDISMQKLLDLAALLGSDVPFFVRAAAGDCSAAFVEGRGERIEPVNAPFLNIVIVNPGIESGTAEAFALLDKAREGGTAGKTPQKRLSKADMLLSLQKNPADWPFVNDFLPVFLEASPENNVYSAILRGLGACGAVFCGLSGSGSSCFGVFPNAQSAKAAAAILAKDWPFVRQAHSVSYHALGSKPSGGGIR